MGRRWATATAVALTVAAAGVAGCGGSSDDTDANTTTTTQLSSAQFAAQAETICADVAAEVARLRVPATTVLSDNREWIDARKAIQERGLAQLDAIAPPAAEQQAYEQLRTTLADRVGTLESAQLKAITEDKTLVDELRAFEEQQRTFTRLTRELRVPSCEFR